MAFKMKGSPAKMGKIQGTSGHTSALKQTKITEDEKNKKRLNTEEDLTEAERKAMLKELKARYDKDEKSDSGLKQKSKGRRKKLSVWDKLRAAGTAMSTSKGPFGDSNFLDRYKGEKKSKREGTYKGDNFKTG